MSVTEAAKRLGVGRVALSNLLNGNSALSRDMAARLEKAFGANRQRLLDMQAAYDSYAHRDLEREFTVRAFVPPFLTIKARQLEEWAAKQIEARAQLAVLLRRLVHSTTDRLHRIDFPGFDNAERPGPDGFTDAAAATPWVPEGRSYWEFGTTVDPKGKADGDYVARVRSIDPAERARSTFIFVTPRTWAGKNDWVAEKRQLGDWKAVGAFDASDLEQWLEQSVPAQIWLAEQLGRPVGGYETLEQAWRRWADACDPRLTSDLFAPSIVAYRRSLKEWLDNPTSRPYVVTADSTGEALAFLACLLEDEELIHYKDLAAVFSSPDTLRTLLASAVPFIPIVHTVAAERELAGAYRRLHCIVVRPRNAVNNKPDSTLEPLNHEAFEKALAAMGIEDDDIDRLSRESGRSPTILRRRLSMNLAIRTPGWAGDPGAASDLAPLALVGVWHAESEADRIVVSYMADRDYKAVEADVTRLSMFDDSPVWSAGQYRGISSKIDALFATAGAVTPAHLERFFEAALFVLSEADPALELPEQDRWAAALYGMKRDHSAALRQGICESLVILAVNGNHLFQDRLGIDIEGRVAQLVRQLLAPLTLEKLLTHNRELPNFAEASPNEFLTIIEDDLRGDHPVTVGLLSPADAGALFASPPRTGLLWALECLAWEPQNLPRVVLILAQLSRVALEDNWMNKPEASLQAIFRSWLPQTAASVEDRCKALEMLVRRFPDVGWRICLEQIKQYTKTGSFTYRPHWRSDATGAGRGVSRKELIDFTRRALDLLLDWGSHNESTLGDLVEGLQGMAEADRLKVWKMIEVWLQTADEPAKAELRERIRRFAFTRPGRNRKLGDGTRTRAKEVYDRLRPKDPVLRHAWLFAEQWVRESVEEVADEDFNIEKREARIDALRHNAMEELWTASGFDGIEKLLSVSNVPSTVGYYAARCIVDVGDIAAFVQQCLSMNEAFRPKANWCLQGFFAGIPEHSLHDVVQGAANDLAPEERARLFACAPFTEATWRLLDTHEDDIRDAYWAQVIPNWGRRTPAEVTELVDRLLEARRPRAAFHAVQFNFEDVETSRLARLLRDVATIGDEATDQFQIDAYHISKAMDSLGSRSGISPDELVQLELLYLDVLHDTEHGIPNLERQVAESPMLFTEAVALAYKRSDLGTDPAEWHIEDPAQKAAAARRAHELLTNMHRIPGADSEGQIDRAKLLTWLTDVRRLCHEHGRAAVGDHCIGQLLARGPEGDNGTWPCEPVCHAMEAIASKEIARGFQVGVYNSRGVFERVNGGDQEREIAARYRSRAEGIRFDYPYVAGVLEGIAKSYERDATREDTEATISRRLQH